MTETLIKDQPPFLNDEYLANPRLVFKAADILSDYQQELLRADQIIQYFGSILVKNTVESPITKSRLQNLTDATKAAAKGDPEAYDMVKTNVACDIVERTIKSGFVVSVDMIVDDQGKIIQHGQNLETIQANSLQNTEPNNPIRERVEAEVRNALILQQLVSLGYLEEYSFLVFSKAADNMTKEEMANAGFFTDTMSCSIQLTSAKNRKITTESAFVSGLKELDGLRHDSQAIELVGQKLGVDLSGSATQVLAQPIIIHNSLIPNGVVDIVKMYDQATDQITATDDTFFGESTGKQDYQLFKLTCQNRLSHFDTIVDRISSELINHAIDFKNPADAAKELHRLSEKEMVVFSVVDKSINPRVFGNEAAFHIEMARWHLDEGNIKQAQKEILIGQKTAISHSCPGGISSRAEKWQSSEDQDNSPKDCEYISNECPICHAKKVKTKVSSLGRNRKVIIGSCGCSKIY